MKRMLVLPLLKRLIPGWRRRAWDKLEREERERARRLGIRSQFDRGPVPFDPR